MMSIAAQIRDLLNAKKFHEGIALAERCLGGQLPLKEMIEIKALLAWAHLLSASPEKAMPLALIAQEEGNPTGILCAIQLTSPEANDPKANWARWIEESHYEAVRRHHARLLAASNDPDGPFAPACDA